MISRFLGGAPTSVCHFFCPSVCHPAYLRNRTSSDHNFWYTHIKWWYLQVLFSFFQNFDFLDCCGGKRAKNGPKWTIITSATHRISGTVHHMIVIFGTHILNADVSRCFFSFFFLILIFRAVRGIKGQKMA